MQSTDENTLGLGKLLRRSGRDDVIYPGHEDLPEVLVGTPDLDWMPVIAHRQLIVVTRDRRIRTRPAGRIARLLGARDQIGVDRRQAGSWPAPTARVVPAPSRTASPRDHQSRTRPVGAGNGPLGSSSAHPARTLEASFASVRSLGEGKSRELFRLPHVGRLPQRVRAVGMVEAGSRVRRPRRRPTGPATRSA